MTYKSHAMIGFSFGFATSQLLNLTILPTTILTISSTIGSLLPDIDHPNSYISHKLPLIAAMFHAFKIKGTMMAHRGITHTPLFWSGFLVLSIAMTKYVPLRIFLFGLCIGGIFHIMADMLTPSGVPFIYPLSDNKISISKIRTGSDLEYAVATLLSISVFYLSYKFI